MGLALSGNSAEIPEHDSRLYSTLPGFLVLHNNQKHLCLQVRSAQYLSLDRGLDRISGSTFYPFWDSVFLIIKIQYSCLLKCCTYHAFYRFACSPGYGQLFVLQTKAVDFNALGNGFIYGDNLYDYSV